ncbi:MAG: hypothetical protein ACJAXX_000511 [Roseivirga sp.]|jgi:hypothetical protein
MQKRSAALKIWINYSTLVLFVAFLVGFEFQVTATIDKSSLTELADLNQEMDVETSEDRGNEIDDAFIPTHFLVKFRKNNLSTLPPNLSDQKIISTLYVYSPPPKQV